MTATILPKQIDRLILSNNFVCKSSSSSSSNAMKMIINDSSLVGAGGGGDHKRSLNSSITQQNDDGDKMATEQIKPKRKRQRLDHLTQEQKVMRRKLKNRMAAQSARDRKKKKMMDLEKENNHLGKERNDLIKRNRYLEQKLKLYIEENDNLRKKLGIEPIKLEPESDDTMELFYSYKNSHIDDDDDDDDKSIKDDDNDVDDYDDDYVDGSDEDSYQTEGASIGRKGWKNGKCPPTIGNYRQNNRKTKSSSTSEIVKGTANEDLLATAVDQLFNGFIGDNLTEFEQQQQQQQQQQKQQSINNGTDNQFGIKTIESDSIKQRKLSSRNGSRIQPMFIGIGETMPIEYINTTISTETCTATDLANDSIIIDHDYAINPTLYTMVTSNMDQNNNDLNIKHNQLSSPQPSSSDNSDIGYESMSSPEPIQSTPKIDNVKIATTTQQFNLFALDDDQKNNILNLENLNIDPDIDLLFPTNIDKEYPNEIDFISEDNLQPSIDEMMTFDSDLHELFPDLF
ncbi:hypothetical protein DERF_007797 [Dermatophagoides farinae]|uniref:X-box-binding protein 1 n=1 Tax=Dermatophagoides farinae TaxID=6954 RepID=A0A922I1U5_DERFA|nr:hypothetical protein DERF_007797 [Dermatophagoides farinae]